MEKGVVVSGKEPVFRITQYHIIVKENSNAIVSRC
jgi:hypothetical protein